MTYPNIQELLALAAGTQGKPSINTDDPDVVSNYLSTQPVLQTPEVRFPAGQTMDQYAVSSTAQPSVLPGARQSVQPAQPQQDDKLSGYEDYLKLFEKTLGPEPELDKKKRNQLAMVAGINALGQALKQVVDYTGRTKHGAPINPQVDQLTPALLGQYEKELQDYQQRKDRYDLLKTNTMQNALQYAYGDEKARERYDNELALLGKQNEYMTGRETQQQKNDLEKIKEQNRLIAERDETLQGYDLKKIEEQYKNESKLIGQRNADALKAMQEKYGMQAAQKAATALAKKSLQVTDPDDVNKPITIPPHIYLDILQKQIALQNQDFTEFLTSTDFNATNNAGDIMVAKYWRDFYDPVKDEVGNVVAFQPKGVASPGGSAVPAGDVPEWFK